MWRGIHLGLSIVKNKVVILASGTKVPDTIYSLGDVLGRSAGKSPFYKILIV